MALGAHPQAVQTVVGCLDLNMLDWRRKMACNLGPLESVWRFVGGVPAIKEEDHRGHC